MDIYIYTQYLSIFSHHFLVNSTNFTGPPFGWPVVRDRRSRRKASPSARCRTSARRARARSCGRGRPSRPSKLWTASTATNACDPGGVGGKKGERPGGRIEMTFFWGKVLEPSTFEVDDVTILWNSGDCASMWFSIERKSAGMATGCWGFWCTAMWVWVIGYPRGSHVVPTTGRP